MTITLGLNAAFHDSAAALVADGQVLAAAEEERFTRIKHAKRPVPFSAWELPFHAIDYCLREAGVTLADVDHVAYSFDPREFLGTRLDAGATALALPLEPSRDATRGGWDNPWDPLFAAYVINAPRMLVDGAPHHLRRRLRPATAPRFAFHHLDHHLCHQASAFLAAPFARCAVMTLDGRGERATTSYGVYRDDAYRPLGTVEMPHSLGLLYERVTSHLGFLHSSDEYKVMALAAMGAPSQAELLRRHVVVGEGGQFRILPLDMKTLFGPPRAAGEPLEPRHFDLAASLQRVLEETVLRLAHWLAEASGEKQLAMAGGVALNCVMNAKLRDAPGLFDAVWVQPAAGDAGTALGAALWVDARERLDRAASLASSASMRSPAPLASVSVRAEPVSVRAEPVFVGAEPVSVGAEPVSVGSEPVSVRAEPVSVRAEPVSVRAEPVSIRAEPASVRAELVEAPRGPSTSSVRTEERGPSTSSVRTEERGPSTSSVRTEERGPSTSSVRTEDFSPSTGSGQTLARDGTRLAPRLWHMTHAYLGPAFADEDVEPLLRWAKLPYRRLDDAHDIAASTARILAAGGIVGWFQGRMEFGPRALGARSILASPIDPRMQARLNELKDREDFRPVAPAVPQEDLARWFSPAAANGGASPFMLFVYDVVPGRAERIPSACHSDATARVQTVGADTNPRFHALLRAFGELTGVPVLVNTSFNVRGEPIVCAPKDAIEAFFSTPLDALVIGPFVVQKSGVAQAAAQAESEAAEVL